MKDTDAFGGVLTIGLNAYTKARPQIGGYTRIPVTDYSRIDGLLSDGAATVVIEWISPGLKGSLHTSR